MTPHQYRSAQLFVSSQLYRWLQWLATANAIEGDEKSGAVADAVAEDILRAAILHNYPNIEQIEAEYQRGRKKLNDEAKTMLKSGHAKLDEGRSEIV